MDPLKDLPNLPDSEDLGLDLDLSDLEELGISEDSLEEDNIFEEITFAEDSPTPEVKQEVKPGNLEELIISEENGSEDDLEIDEIELEFDNPTEDLSVEDVVLESSDDLDLDIDSVFIDDEELSSGVPINDLEELAAQVNKENIITQNVQEESIPDIIQQGPEWFKELLKKKDAQISHAFLLDFNVKDYIYRRYTLEELLTSEGVLGTYDMILKYDLAGGLQFLGRDESLTKEMFYNATGLSEKMQNLQEDEVFQALNDEPVVEEPTIPDGPLEVFTLLSPLFKQKTEDNNSGRILLYVESIEMILPDAPIAQMSLTDRKLLMLLEEMAGNSAADAFGNCLIMTTDNAHEVNSDLRRSSNRVEKISIPLPNKEERVRFIEEEIVASNPDLFKGKLTAQGFSNLSAGLSKIQIEDVALRAHAENTVITEDLVRDRKTDIIRSEYEDVIEIIDSDIGFNDIGGMDTIKQYFIEEVIKPILNGEEDYWRVPLGIMFLGPAGTGKTLLAQGAAKESQMNCVNLNIAKILNKYVGSSEKNFEKALQCIASMEPTIVIVEEIDNVFAGRGTDSSGVGGRLFKRFLEFMSDTSRRGKVIVIATSNYPSRMDAALKRPGRFDKKIPFLVPETNERLSIINVLIRRKGFEFEIPDINTLKNKQKERGGKAMLLFLKKTDGMTGAELETIVQKAITYTFKRGEKLVTGEDILKASTVVIPSTSAIMEMTREALIECNDLEFIPKKYRKYATELKKTLVEKIPEIEPGSTTGSG